MGYIVANKEELAAVDLIAKREGIQPQQRKTWAKIWVLLAPLDLQLHPCIQPSSGRMATECKGCIGATVPGPPKQRGRRMGPSALRYRVPECTFALYPNRFWEIAVKDMAPTALKIFFVPRSRGKVLVLPHTCTPHARNLMWSPNMKEKHEN